MSYIIQELSPGQALAIKLAAEGPPHVTFSDLDLYSSGELKEMKRKGLRR